MSIIRLEGVLNYFVGESFAFRILIWSYNSLQIIVLYSHYQKQPHLSYNT